MEAIIRMVKTLNPIFSVRLYNASYNPKTNEATVRIPISFIFLTIPYTIKGKITHENDENTTLIFHYIPKLNVTIMCSDGKKRKLRRDNEYSVVVNFNVPHEALITDRKLLQQFLS